MHGWLRKNDEEWFENHSPSQVRRKGFRDLKSWNEIDKSLAKEVREICNEIYNLESFPIRVSLAEIIRRTGKQNWLQKRKKKLPITNKLLEQNLESLEDFLIRRINWTKAEFIKEKKIPTLLQLKVRAVVVNKVSGRTEKITNFLSETLEEIKACLLS